MKPLRLQLIAKFWDRVDFTGDCWIWQGPIDSGGYGSFSAGRGAPIKAHRMAWMLTRWSPVPDGLWVCHRCDNRPCVRPDHLFLGTPLENTHDMIAKSRARWQRNPEPAVPA